MSQEPPIMIREVWAFNLEAEFDLIRRVVKQFPYISMDTEFPGVIYAPKGDRRHLQPSDHYIYLKGNVDNLKLIQVGLTLADRNGNLPRIENKCCIWEFNFREFDVERDAHNRDSIDMLQRQGIDLRRNMSHGVDSSRFSQLMINSGLVFNPSVIWVTFHSAYDFGYLVKILYAEFINILLQNKKLLNIFHKHLVESNDPTKLPERLEDFLYLLTFFFGKKVYDMKHMMRFCDALYGGLERVATTLNVRRVAGKSHQAGSDSLLTWHAYKKMMDTYFVNDDDKKHAGILFGLELPLQIAA